MSHGPTKIPSKGYCIYCRDASGTLTDEHIVPLSLGGQHVIQKASCATCADITKRFEQDVARGLWGDARSSYNAPSRRKSQRKPQIVLHPPASGGGPLVVPSSEYPAPLVFYKMSQAGYLRGASPSDDHSKEWTLVTIVDEPRLRAFEKKYPGRLTAQFKHVPVSFGRLLAKIGYGQMLCSLDPVDFDPICVPYILGTQSNLSYIVGSRPTYEPPESGIGYRMSSHRVGTRDKLLLVSEIRLIANNQTPTYHVVIGRVTGLEAATVARDKLKATMAVDLADGAAIPDVLPENLHWMPRTWPPGHGS